VSENNEDAVEVRLIDRLIDFFRNPVYIWDIAKKRAFLVLDALARWNPRMGTLYQDQLIHMCGLDVGPSTGPNNLRAVKIAIRKGTSIQTVAQGNGINRTYRFASQDVKNEVEEFMTLPKWSRIRQHLQSELLEHRRRGW